MLGDPLDHHEKTIVASEDSRSADEESSRSRGRELSLYRYFLVLVFAGVILVAAL